MTSPGANTSSNSSGKSPRTRAQASCSHRDRAVLGSASGVLNMSSPVRSPAAGLNKRGASTVTSSENGSAAMLTSPSKHPRIGNHTAAHMSSNVAMSGKENQ